MDVSNLVPKGPLGVLHNYLVGRWREVPTSRPSEKEVESWARVVWRLKGGSLVAFLHEDLMFFFFIDKKQIYYKAKIKKRNPSKKVPNHTQEVYKEEPKRLAYKTKDETTTRRSGSPKKRTKHKKDLPSPQPGQKIYQRVRLFDTMSIGQCPQFTQEETFCPLIRSYLIFEFTLPEEVSRALVMEPRSLRGGLLDLGRWNPNSGFAKSRDCAKEVWIRVVGLPLNLWTGEILKQRGEGCGGFISMDKEMTLGIEVKWARLRVSLKGEIRPSSLNILAGERSYELQIWWELQLWVARVYLARGVSRLGVLRLDEEDKPPSRANQCAWSKEDGDSEKGRLGRGGVC